MDQGPATRCWRVPLPVLAPGGGTGLPIPHKVLQRVRQGQRDAQTPPPRQTGFSGGAAAM